jgi:hypothetical protein
MSIAPGEVQAQGRAPPPHVAEGAGKNRAFARDRAGPGRVRRMRRTGGHGWSPRACAQQGLRSAMPGSSAIKLEFEK